MEAVTGTGIHAYRSTRVLRYRVQGCANAKIQVQGYKDINDARVQRYTFTEMQGRDPRIQVCRGTGIQGYKITGT